MGKHGPPKLPTALKIERGTYRPDRDNPDQPEPDGPPELPPWYGRRDRLSKRATELWDSRAPDLAERGILCRRESEPFANYCMEQAKYEEFNRLARRRGEREPERFYRMADKALDRATRLAGKFGLTASDRTGVKVKRPSTGGSDRRKRFFGADEDTPEHLREVIKADVKIGFTASEVGDALPEISPRRVIAELIARTLDGSVGDESAEPPSLGSDGEHGRTLQTWSAMSDIMSTSLARDPLDKDDGK